MSFPFQNVEELSATYDNIVGDVLLSASMVAYMGPFIMSYRQVSTHRDVVMCKHKQTLACI